MRDSACRRDFDLDLQTSTFWLSGPAHNFLQLLHMIRVRHRSISLESPTHGVPPSVNGVWNRKGDTDADEVRLKRDFVSMFECFQDSEAESARPDKAEIWLGADKTPEGVRLSLLAHVGS